MYFYVFICFIIFTCIIPISQYLIFHGNYKITENVKAQQVFNIILVYPILGYFLHNFFEIKMIRKLLWIWLFNFLVILLCALLTYYRWKITGDLKQPSAEMFYNCSAFFNCASIFLTARYIFDKVVLPKSVQKAISFHFLFHLKYTTGNSERQEFYGYFFQFFFTNLLCHCWITCT